MTQALLSLVILLGGVVIISGLIWLSETRWGWPMFCLFFLALAAWVLAGFILEVGFIRPKPLPPNTNEVYRQLAPEKP